MDECEWRYIPDVEPLELAQVILNPDINNANLCNWPVNQ